MNFAAEEQDDLDNDWFHVYKEDKEIGFVWVNFGFRETDTLYTNSVGLYTPVLDKDKFFKEFVEFTQAYCERQEEDILKQLENGFR